MVTYLAKVAAALSAGLKNAAKLRGILIAVTLC